MTRFVRNTLLVMLVLSGLYLLWVFRSAVMVFLFSLVVAAVFRPAVDGMMVRGVPRPIAILLPYVFGLGLLAGLIYLGSRSFVSELEQATNQFAAWYNHIQTAWVEGTPAQQAIVQNLPPLENLYTAISGEQGTALFRTLIGYASNLMNVLASLATVIVLAIYWSADHVYFERLWLSTLRTDLRTQARNVWREVEQGVGAYVRSEVVQSLIIAVLLNVIFRLLGLPYPTLLALFGGLVWLVPWLGSALAVVPPMLVGFAHSQQLGILVALATLGVLLFLEIVIEPRLFNRRRYSSLLIVLLLIALADLYGIIGVILAPPLAAALQIAFKRLAIQPAPTVNLGEAAEELNPFDDLHARIELMRADVAQKEDIPPQILNLAARLQRLAERAEAVVGEQ